MPLGGTMENQNRRKIVLINRQFQFRLIAKFVILNAVIMLVFGALMFLFLNSEIQKNLYSAHVTYSNLRDMLFPILLTLSIINIVISSVIIAGFVLFASHKLAGPIYRFTQTLEDMVNKIFKPFPDIRDGDQFIVFSRTLKQMSESVSGLLKEIKGKLTLMKSQTEQGNTQELKKSISDLSSTIDQYRLD